MYTKVTFKSMIDQRPSTSNSKISLRTAKRKEWLVNILLISLCRMFVVFTVANGRSFNVTVKRHIGTLIMIVYILFIFNQSLIIWKEKWRYQDKGRVLEQDFLLSFFCYLSLSLSLSWWKCPLDIINRSILPRFEIDVWHKLVHTMVVDRRQMVMTATSNTITMYVWNEKCITSNR